MTRLVDDDDDDDVERHDRHETTLWTLHSRHGILAGLHVEILIVLRSRARGYVSLVWTAASAHLEYTRERRDPGSVENPPSEFFLFSHSSSFPPKLTDQRRTNLSNSWLALTVASPGVPILTCPPTLR